MKVQIALAASKRWKEILAGSIVFIGILAFSFFPSGEDPSIEYFGDGTGGTANVSPLVRRYEPLVNKYAVMYGVDGYTELLLAKMMQESGGRGGDPMQSSESLGLPPNSITDPELSIKQGVYYFSVVLKNSKGDFKIALQSYNFGGGFIDYAFKNGGYSREVAAAFSDMKAKELGWSSYGDVDYVPHILRYLAGGSVSGPVNAHGFAKPINAPMSSRFGYRADPFTGFPDFHAGNDYGCGGKPLPIFAAKNGVVSKTGWQNPGNHRVGYGQRIYIDHGGSVTTVYGHLSKIGVSVGQKVQAGQVIGACGTTGSSTGMHLHFELHLNSNKVDPTEYIQ
jgi:murein DD-endopeptidase MepM/ murein hydrolase activator NlpD